MGRDPRGLVQFRVLGPLEAWRDGAPLRLGGPRQRALLAFLLVHANELVTTERLVDELLGDGLSESAVNTTRVAVSRLRRVLENGGAAGPLLTQPGGYMLKAGPEQLDAAMFERLLEDGRWLLAEGDAASAATRLREALAMWRGPPLADLSQVEFIQAEIYRLEELRLMAVMERIDADLAVGRNAELIAELETLVASNLLQERLRGQLMLALYRAGRQADALAVYRQTSELLRDGLGLKPSRELQELERSILRQDAALDPERRTVAERAPGEGLAVCPFKGLAFFDRSDAEYFCGRERVVSELIAQLASATLVGIVGPSGIGKSSLLRAGVLPALSVGVLPGSASWRQVLLRPGARPCAELGRALQGNGMRDALARLEPGERFVLAVDQLEELFTVCEQDSEREAFVEELVVAARDHDQRALVLVSLRADFYGRCASYSPFAELLSRNHALIGPMDRDELARAIELPANRAGLEVEHALVDALLADVRGEPGGLPLMSTALLELWRVRQGRVLSYTSYRATGGVHGAVARLAEGTVSRLSKSEQSVARELMLRLATGEQGSLVRRRLPLTELGRVDGAERVLLALTEARLLTASDDEVEVSHEALFREWPRFRAWIEEDRVGRRLHTHLAASAQEWEARGRDRADLYRGARLGAALDWVTGHPRELNTVEREFVDASRAEADSETRRQRSQNRRLRGLLAGVGVLLVLAATAGIIALVKQQSATSAARIALAGQLGAEAVSEPRTDLAMLLAREAVRLDRSPQTEGTLLATLLHSPSVLGTFTLPTGARPEGVSASPDGRTVAISDNVGDVNFYDARTHAVQRPPMHDLVEPTTPVYAGNDLLLAAGNDKTQFVDIRDAHTLAVIRRLTFDRLFYATLGADNRAGSILVSPDRRTVYYAYWLLDAAGHPRAAYLDRWSLPSGRLLSRTAIGYGPVLAFRLVAGGTRLIVVNSSRASVFAVPSLSRVSSVTISPASGPNAALAISPDGRAAAIGAPTGSVAFVNLSTGSVSNGVGGHGAAVEAMGYSPNGRLVVSAGDDDKVIVWNPATAHQIQVLTGHGAPVVGVAFSADSQTLYTASQDGAVFEWDLGGARRFGRPITTSAHAAAGVDEDTPAYPPLAVSPGGTRFAIRRGRSVVILSTRTLQQLASFRIGPSAGGVTALAWSPSGAMLAVGGHSGAVQLWSTNGSPRLLRSLVGLRAPPGRFEAVQAVAFGPAGRLLAATDHNRYADHVPQDGFAAIWRVQSGTLVAAPRDLHHAGDTIAFSPDGRELALGRDDGPVLIIAPNTAAVLRTLRPLGVTTDAPATVAFAPDGMLATGSWAGIVQFWDPRNGRQLAHPAIVASGPVAGLAFDPSGRRFATTTSDGTSKLWYSATLQEQGAALQGEPSAFGSLAFTSDGKSLVVIDSNGHGFVWPTTIGAWEQHACQVAGRNLSHEEWARFVSGHSYAPVCP